MRQLFLHTGAAKTGTSALQLFFHEHRDWLAEHGIHYPIGSHHPDPRTSISSGNGGWLFGYLSEGRYWDEFVEQLTAGTESGDVLISSELLAKVAPDRIALLHERLAALRFDLAAFYLVRNPDEWYVSAYQQNVKRHGYVGDFDSFCRLRALEFPIALTNYEAALGDGALHLLSYESGKADIVSYVVREGLGIQSAIPEHDNSSINRSLTAFELEVLRLANHDQRAEGVDPELIGRRGTAISDHFIAGRRSVPAAARYRGHPMPADVVEHLRPAVEQINTRLADGRIGFSITEAAPALDQTQQEAAHILAQLLWRQASSTEQYDLLRREQEDLRQALTSCQRTLAAELSALRNSHSWRVTAPLRALTAAARKHRSRVVT